MKTVVSYSGPYKYGPKTTGSLAGRKFMIRYYDDGSKGITLHSRYLMEQSLGHALDKNEIVHHIDGDKTNDTLENLQVILRKEHMKEHPVSIATRAAISASMPPFTHGTRTGWMRTKCTCAICSIAKRAWYDERNAKRRAAYVDGAGPRGKYYHGGNSMYANGCRCEACTIAHRDAIRAYRLKNK